MNGQGFNYKKAIIVIIIKKQTFIDYLVLVEWKRSSLYVTYSQYLLSSVCTIEDVLPM